MTYKKAHAETSAVLKIQKPFIAVMTITTRIIARIVEVKRRNKMKLKDFIRKMKEEKQKGKQELWDSLIEYVAQRQSSWDKSIFIHLEEENMVEIKTKHNLK